MMPLAKETKGLTTRSESLQTWFLRMLEPLCGSHDELERITWDFG